jgi:Flp pilus assembly protein TadD
LLAKNPKDGRILMQQALLLERALEFKKALSAYEQIVALNPNFLPALNNGAYLIAEHGGDLDKALLMARKAAQLSADNASVQDTLGWILFKRGDVTEAANILKQSAAKQTGIPDSQFHYAMSCYSSGETEAARVAFAKALSSGRDFRGKSEAQWRAETLALVEQKPDAQTIAKLEAAQKQHSKEAGVLSLLGETYERLNQAEKATQHYEQALALNSNSAPVMLKLAALLARLPGREESALKAIKRAQPLVRDNPQFKQSLARTAMVAGDFALAATLFQEAMEATKDPEINYDLALCRFYMGDIAGSEGMMRRISGKQVGFARSTEAQQFNQLLDFYTRPAESRATLASVREILKSKPDWAPALFLLARAQKQSGSTNQSRETLETIIKQRPLLIPAATELAGLLQNSQESDKAKLLLEAAQKVAPLDSANAGLYGQVLYSTGNYSNAVKALRDGSRATRIDPEVLYYLGLAYDKVGDKQQSKRTLNDALRLHPGHKLAADAQDVLERYLLESKATKQL